MKMMTIMAGGLQTTNRLGSWVEQPNRMNLSLLERDDDDKDDDDEDADDEDNIINDNEADGTGNQADIKEDNFN